MTVLSVNLNKLALLRNSRGRDYPNILEYTRRFIDLGVKGITIHPRPDERHIRYQDARDLSLYLENKNVELNIEGFPSSAFMQLVEETSPDQCTLVPDAVDQLTSDHGWNFHGEAERVKDAVSALKAMGVRSSVFLDPDPEQAGLCAATGADRIELYTEHYADSYSGPEREAVLNTYRETALAAQLSGMAVNAGHDLDLDNLACFLTIPGIAEVSIGHALTIECIDQGMSTVVQRYLDICQGAAKK